MKFLPLLLIVTICGVILCLTPLHAQPETTIIYLLTTTQSEYSLTVSSLDGDGSESETLYTVPFESKGELPTLFPQEEVDSLNEYLTTLQSIPGRVSVPLTEILVSGKINSIFVSPNRQQVIVQASYERCLNPQHTICFGSTQLILIDRLNKSQRLLLNLGRHPNVYMSTYSEIFTNFVIRSLQWTPDQQAIVVGIADVETRLQIPRSAIVILPIDGSEPFKVGEGTRWVIAPDSREIAVITTPETQREDVPDTLKLIRFDLASKQSSTTSYSVGTYFIYYDRGIVYADQFPLFSIAFDTSKLGDGDWVGGGLTFFDTQTGTPTIAVPNPQGYVSRLDNTPDGKITVAQMTDGTLSRILIVGMTMELHPITSTPVASWNLSSNGELLVQFAGDNTYQMLDAQGNIKQSFDLSQAMRSAASEETQIIAVDW